MKRTTIISKQCTNCGKEVWPQVSPAIIVRIRRGDEILLVHAKNFRRSEMYGLVAGFVETGETLEECVRREVHEEVGLEIKNIRYFGSQPWPYPCGIMIGFTADYAGGQIHLQEEELSSGKWFDRDHLPQIPDKMSIARKLIDDYIAEKRDQQK
jgi:NAD+ diphosphatase